MRTERNEGTKAAALADPRAFLERLFRSAVAAADPERALLPFLPPPPMGRTVVVGAGKGAAQLARALERMWPGPLHGTVVTRHGHAVACERIEVIEAGHPVPDAAGLAASRRLIERVSGLSADDLVIALICGGGSALLPAPPEGFALGDEIALNRLLLASGAPIGVMNALRRPFSRIKGGRLAVAAHPARVVSLIVSDVPGDDPAEVASGPTVASPTDGAAALALAAPYRIALPERVRDHIAAARPPLPSDPRLARAEAHVIASSRQSLEAAAEAARAAGLCAEILSDAIEGEAREAGSFHAALACEVARRDRPFRRPVVLLSGGETSVTRPGTGRGGRNTEFLLAFAKAIAGTAGIHALAADTDGIDGTGPQAGAFADATTVARMAAAGQDVGRALADHDSATAFAAIGDLFVTGPTGTNVNDFRAILIA